MRECISPKIRLEVFKKSDFKCRYCWRTPSDWIKLQVDHIIPVAKWWWNELENLCTACRECNIWKWKNLINNKELNVDYKKKIKELKEQEKILKQYLDFKKKIKDKKEQSTAYNIYTDIWYDIWFISVNAFNKLCEKYSSNIIEEALSSMEWYIGTDKYNWAYFTAICKHKHIQDIDWYNELTERYRDKMQKRDYYGNFKKWMYKDPDLMWVKYKFIDEWWFDIGDIRYNYESPEEIYKWTNLSWDGVVKRYMTAFENVKDKILFSNQ